MVGGQRMMLPPLGAPADAGRPVTIGIRPEHARLVDPGAPGAVRIEVDLVEPLGSEALLHAELDDAPFIMKAETRGALHVTGPAAFTIGPHLMRVFDAETGRGVPARLREAAA